MRTFFELVSLLFRTDHWHRSLLDDTFLSFDHSYAMFNTSWYTYLAVFGGIESLLVSYFHFHAAFNDVEYFVMSFMPVSWYIEILCKSFFNMNPGDIGAITEERLLHSQLYLFRTDYRRVK